MKNNFKLLLFLLILGFLISCGRPKGNKNEASALPNETEKTDPNNPVYDSNQSDINNNKTDSVPTSPSDSRQKFSSAFFPLAVGNYWVYQSVAEPTLSDTVKVIRQKKINEELVFELSDGQLLFEKNDTVYAMQAQRSGYLFPTIQYFPSEKQLTYDVVVGGDVVSSRTVSKPVTRCRVLNHDYNDCYRYEQSGEYGRDFHIISRGIGFIEKRSGKQHLVLSTYFINN